MVKGKRGWMRVLEVFIALLLITSVSLIAVNEGYKSNTDVSSNILDVENSILRDIQYNDLIRDEILGQETLPVEWENLPANLKGAVESGTPDYLECQAKICDVNVVCEMENLPEKDIYIQHVPIIANFDKYNPTILKLACWKKI